MPLTLIQLISEQTMQNVLPVLRLKPSRLVHFATPRTVSRSALVAEAARQAGHAVDLETITLSAMPSMTEMRGAVLGAIERAAQEGAPTALNFTGGTKLMSIGAYVAALHHKTPSFYVDTQDALFVDGRTGEGMADLFGSDWSFTPLLRSISVNVIAKANGCGRVTGGRDWMPLSAFAEHLLAHPDEERVLHEALHGKRGIFPDGKEPRTPSDWLAKLDADIPLPPTICRFALESGLLSPGKAEGSARLPDASRAELAELAAKQSEKVPGFFHRYVTAVAAPQMAATFLGGGWWEVVLAGRMRRCGRFRDIRWSVQIGERGGPDLEEDIVAVEGVQGVYVSCKRGGHRNRLLPLLDEINARARTFGGTFTRRFLAIRFKPQGNVLANLDRRARELGIRLIFPEQLAQADPFA